MKLGLLLLTILLSTSSLFAATPEVDKDCQQALSQTTGWRKFFADRFYQILHPKPKLQLTHHEAAKELHFALKPLMDAFVRAATRVTLREAKIRVQTIQKHFAFHQAEFEEYFDEDYADEVFVGPTNAIDSISPLASGTIKHASKMIEMFHISKAPETLERIPKYQYLDSEGKMSIHLGLTNTQMSMVITPVSGYGEEFDRKRMLTTRIMMNIAAENLGAASVEAYRKNKILLDQYTARARDQKEERITLGNAPLASFNEGILSLNQIINLLLAKKIDGIDSPLEALKAIVEMRGSKAGLVSEASARVVMGLTGPASLAGVRFIEPAVVKNSQGHVALSNAFKTYNLKERNQSNQKHSVCPFAALFRKDSPKAETVTEVQPLESKTGIQELAEIYLRIFEMVNQMEVV